MSDFAVCGGGGVPGRVLETGCVERQGALRHRASCSRDLGAHLLMEVRGQSPLIFGLIWFKILVFSLT
jgi:hypothetical protein